MKRYLIFFSFLVSSFSYAQTTTQPVELKKVFGGYQFYQGTKRLTMNKLVNSLKSNSESYAEIKKAQTNYYISSLIGGVGGFMVGFPIGTAMGGGEANWKMAGIGAGIIALSVPISIRCNKQIKKATEIFNSSLNSTSFWNKHDLRLSLALNKAGVSISF